MKIIIILFVQLVLQISFSFKCLGQICFTSFSSGCGSITAVGGICNSQITFCIGDSVGIENNTVGVVDTSFICWGDGTINTYVGRFSGCRKHLYMFPVDSCILDGTGEIFLKIQLGVSKKLYWFNKLSLFGNTYKY